MSSVVAPNNTPIPGRATRAGTLQYAARFKDRLAAGHFREGPGGIFFSSIGIGTYLGEPDRATDEGYEAAAIAAVENGANVTDSAINYRFQRSERSIGRALKKLLAKGYSREEVVLCTKAGFLTPDGEMPADVNDYFAREYVDRGLFGPEDVAAGCHCMAPSFLADQLERSRRNFGAESVDIFYLHNPETQLAEISREQFRSRVRDAFIFLESAVEVGKIGAYGMATWNAFRDDPRSPGYLSLAEIAGIAREVAGQDHRFRFVQLPFNLAMPEALARPNQEVEGRFVPPVQAARDLGITLIASASLLQGQLAKKLPPAVRSALGLAQDSELALQFARSAPGITTALVGMSRTEHVQANLALAMIEPASREQMRALFESLR